VASGAATDNNNRYRAPWHGQRWRCRRLQFLAYECHALALFDLPAWQAVQRGWTQRRTGPQTEAGMMPGTADRIADNESLSQRTAIVGAGGSDRQQVATAPHEQSRRIADMAP
jgi:hypothetical protein